MKPLLSYTLLRLLLLVVVGAFLFALGLRGLLLIAVAFLASGLLSYVVLRDQRVRLGRSVSGVFSRLNARIDAAARAEDDIDVRDAPVAETDRRPGGPVTPPAAP